ncbi:MAG: ATP-binding protein [Firmicutes bacterium]|nr:ATP-binding protein [Bacillota bacterium]
MLLRFKIKNFLSFYEETVFDMFPNIKREKFSHHIYNDMDVPLLKQAAIYGANGSGKSNFIKAVAFLREFVTLENFLETIDLDDYIFQLTKEKSQTISIEIEFFRKNKYYLYNVDISKKEIYEKLSISGLNKSEDNLIFERKGTSIKSDYLQNNSAVEVLLQQNPCVSLLPLNKRFPIIINDDVNNAFDWFMNKLVFVSIKSTIPTLIDLMSNDSKLLNFTNTIFEKIGIGINSLKIKNTSFDKWIGNEKNAENLKQLIENNQQQENVNISQMVNDRNTFNISLQKGSRIVQEFMFDQTGQSDFHKEMKISAQSDGTVRILTLIPALYGAMFEQKTIFVDEIDNSIHPNLMFELLKFYANNKSDGQLIFTTHTTNLLNQQELLRPDEIWLTEKLDGNTRMYSLNDFKLHNTLNIENGYLDGRYGGVPVIEEISMDV